ncbi:alpha-2-HS-glycoprotein [Bufo gargarizans]|uniref:alpha-2-HS-glycoprotein n=1 Tax=Bufo gargarizans TaxID=30331 RepID=UPI001CF3543B|nr:alpha-2-HS-glycoprotein [Bufo gargarizans]
MMKILIILASLLLCQAVVLPLTQPGRVVNCDDPEVHEGANLAVKHINSQHRTGYKFALDRVENVNVQSSAFGEFFYLELDLLETLCPSLSPVPVENCSMRPITEQAVEGDCDVKLQKQNGTFTVLRTKCKSELDSAENLLRSCPGCLLAPLNDTQVVHAVDVSLNKFNGGNNTAFYFLHEIGRGRIQSGISNSVHAEYIIAASNCTIDDVNAGVVPCVEETGANAHFGACTGTVVTHQGAVDEEVTVTCTIYEPQVAEAVAPPAPPALPQTKGVHSHFHHSLHLGPQSSESNSAEQAHHAVRRSLAGEHVPHLPLCPGRKLHN